MDLPVVKPGIHNMHSNNTDGNTFENKKCKNILQLWIYTFCTCLYTMPWRNTAIMHVFYWSFLPYLFFITNNPHYSSIWIAQSTVTMLQDGWGFDSNWGRDIFLHHRIQTYSETHSEPHQVDTRSSFAMDKMGITLTTLLHLVLKVMTGDTTTKGRWLIVGCSAKCLSYYLVSKW